MALCKVWPFKISNGSEKKYPKGPRRQSGKDDRIPEASAVARKRSKAQGVGGKPTNVKTILKRDMGECKNW